MEQDDQSATTPQEPSARALRLPEFAFACNLISAISYALLVYAEKRDLGYYVLRAAIRVDDILHFSQTNAVTTQALRRNSQNPWTLFAGTELAILISMFAAVMLVLLFLRLSPDAWYRLMMGDRCDGFLALFALPVSYLCTFFWHAGPNLGFWPDLTNAAESRYALLFWLLLVADVLCAAILYFLSRVRPLSRWVIGILLFLHYAFWLAAMSPPASLVSGVVSLSFIAFPFSGAVWLGYLKPREDPIAIGKTRKIGKWTVAGAAVSGAMVLVIWYPHRARSLSHPRNIGSVSVELSRGRCFGSCPSYSLTVHGDGVVEYRGVRFVRIKEKQTSRITTEQLTQLLRDLDRMDFFAVEDRAFQWCYDSSSVSISVSVDGRQKRVTTDNCAPGPKGGPKASFLQIADEIDAVADSNQWVSCNGFCRN